MPGSIKVGGAQRTVVAPYVKVSGAWRSASIAYVKVAGTWRQWYAANITDNFNRANSSTLGTVSNGVTSWSTLQGSWAISSNTAVGTGTNALAAVSNPLQSADYELKLDVSDGNGLAFWITDANNWWSVTAATTSSTSYTCPNGGSLSGTSCVTSGSYAATYNSSSYVCGTYTPGGSGTYGSVVTTQYEPTGNACGSFCTNIGGTCISGGCYIANPTETCDGNTSRPGSACSYSYSGSCSTGSYNGSACVCDNSYYSCPSGGSLSGSTCYTSSSYSATANTTYSYLVRVSQSVAGSFNNLATYTVPSATASLKVVTANNLVTVTSYSAAGQSGTATTNTFTATSPTRTAIAGIVGVGTVDNFGLK